MSAPLPDEELAAMGYVTDEYSRAKAKRDRDEIEPQSPDAWYQQKARVADREAATPPQPAPSAGPPAPGTALLCTDHTGTYRCWIERAELDRALAQFGLAIVPANQPCSGCAAARELLERLGEVIEDYGPGRQFDTAADALDAIIQLLASHPSPAPVAATSVVIPTAFDGHARPDDCKVKP